MRKLSLPSKRPLVGSQFGIQSEADYIREFSEPVCGVDEAGRGPVAGPVVAGAVIYRDCESLRNSCDSKALSASAREELFRLMEIELEFAVGMCSPEEIDRDNILRASLTAMRRAINNLHTKPNVILVDGIHLPFEKSDCILRAVPHGDAFVKVIGAASIVAKVTRDRIMRDYDRKYPGYGFARHMGYPTSLHRQALQVQGPCPIHRRTFKGVREYFQTAAEDE